MLKVTAILFLAWGCSFYANGQSHKIDTTYFDVAGVCGMCKDRIENAAYIKGVKMVIWNQETNQLMAVYDPKKTNPLVIQQAVAEHGHDTRDVKADESAYDKLPNCCAYREGVEKH